MPKFRSTMIAVALAATATVPLAPPALAEHACNIEDPTLDQACESHGYDHPIIKKLLCLVLPTC